MPAFVIGRHEALTLALAVVMAFSARADESASLAVTVEAADSAFFSAVFDACDPGKVSSMLSDDFEFFHDKWGQIAKSKAEFVTAIAGACERQRLGTDFKARRRLFRPSLQVHPMKSYGALEMGAHDFFRVEADGKLTPTEHARFTHLWRLEGGKLRLARVISYAHVDGPAPWARK